MLPVLLRRYDLVVCGPVRPFTSVSWRVRKHAPITEPAVPVEG